jgi:type IV pilus assembly protein PilN
MIKINLIGDRRPVVARRARSKAGFGGQNTSVLLLGGFTLLGLLIAAGWWYVLTSKLEEEVANTARKQAEVKRLEDILAEVENFKAKKKDLETRIQVINELSTAQRGPVAIMDGVSRALPEQLWLEQMTVSATAVDVSGQAMNTNAVAAFIENLTKVPEFKEPNARDMSRKDDKTTVLYTFRLDFPYVLTLPAAAITPAAEAAPAAAGAQQTPKPGGPAS